MAHRNETARLLRLPLRCVRRAGGYPSTNALAPWPRKYSWALVLTHDVETSTGYRNVHLLRHLELEADFRSSWNFVPRRYEVEDSFVNKLLEDGFEVGVHGLYHDGRDFASLSTLLERIPAMRAYAQRWRAVGFRSPATHRVWEWMPLLGFDYDSSFPDTDPYEPQPGGCCTWLPYFNEELVELPITCLASATAGGKRVGRRRAASHLERSGQGWRIVGPAAEDGRIFDR